MLDMKLNTSPSRFTMQDRVSYRGSEIPKFLGVLKDIQMLLVVLQFLTVFEFVQ